MKTKKRPSRETVEKSWRQGPWTVCRGKLVPSRGRPTNIDSLFKVVGEKLPFECLADVEKDMKANGLSRQGIYLAHDSMGAARYAGRGAVFNRLRSHIKAHPLELHYFSFYIIPDKRHEREIETIIIRSSSHLLSFNDRKKRPTIEPGNIRDYEGGTFFYERQRTRGKRKR